MGRSHALAWEKKKQNAQYKELYRTWSTHAAHDACAMDKAQYIYNICICLLYIYIYIIYYILYIIYYILYIIYQVGRLFVPAFCLNTASQGARAFSARRSMSACTSATVRLFPGFVCTFAEPSINLSSWVGSFK